MERVEEIKLISKTVDVDEIGQETSTETERTVLASIGSISAREFFDAGQNGLKAECKATLADYLDYEDEETVVLNNTRYTVYRTYVRDDWSIELYLRKDTGS